MNLSRQIRIPYILYICLAAFVLCLVAWPAAAQSSRNIRLKTVVIDAGHGGKDPGCISRDKKTYEKNITLDVAKRFGQKIKDNYPDVKVIYTRSDDRYVTLSGRADIANRNNANLFVSIHVNSASSTQAYGFSSHILGNGKHDLVSANKELCKRENSVIMLEEDYSTKYQGWDPTDPESFIFFNLMQNAFYEQSLLFADEANKAMTKGPIRRNRGISQDPFLVLWKTTMPSVLVEIGFMTNTNDLAAMRSSSGRDKIAQCLFNGFRNFKAKYDDSLDYSKEKQVLQDVAHGKSSAPVSSAVSSSGNGYGVQVFAVGKKLNKGDKAFKGEDVVGFSAGNVYKYVILTETAAQAKDLQRKLKDRFPGSFAVKVRNGVVSRL